MKTIHILLVLMLFSLFNGISYSIESPLDEVKQKLPELLGANNVGKEFWFSIPPCFEDESGGYANFIRIFVTSPNKTLVTVEVPGWGFKQSRNTIQNDVIEIKLTPVQASPWQKTGGQPTPKDTVFKQLGVHVFSELPITVYCVVRYKATSDGFLAIPVSSLGKEYIVSAAEIDPMFGAVWGYKFPATTCITAPFDNTKVNFTLGGNSVTKTAGGMKPGETKEWIMNEGDVLAIATDISNSDLSGSRIDADKPISVVSGNFCANIPVGNQWCDYTVEMETPVKTWNNVYHVGKIPNRKLASFIKIFARDSNTKIYRNGSYLGTISKPYGKINEAFLFMRMTGDLKPKSVVISGDKPINVVLFNTGVQEDGYPLPNSDPFVMSTIPITQYQNEILFCTPGIMGGQNFPENYINLVYETDSLGKMPDHFEFAGPVHGGQFTWSQLNKKFTNIDEVFSYDIIGKKYALKTIKLPTDGVYKIRANTPFGAYSFGFSYCDSYGYPTSAALKEIDPPDTLLPVPTWTLSCNGSVDDGKVTDMPEDSKVRKNLSMIVFLSDFSYNYEFKYQDFIPGETRTTDWTLEVINPDSNARAIITFSDRAGNDTTILIEYNTTPLMISPKMLDLGYLCSSDSSIVELTIKNNSSDSAITIRNLKLKYGNRGFSFFNLPNIFPIKLEKSDSFKFKVKYLQKGGGLFEDSIGYEDDCRIYYQSLLKAKTNVLSISVDDVIFDVVPVGIGVKGKFHIKNEGTENLIVSGFKVPVNSSFSTNMPAIDSSNPLVLKPSEYREYELKFTPNQIGKFVDSIVFISNAGSCRKNYCSIYGEGKIPCIQVTGYDWQHKRIRAYYQGGNTFEFKNHCYNDVKIISMLVKENINGDAFEFDRKKITDGFTIPKNSSVNIPVQFHPVKQGLHSLELTFVSEDSSFCSSILKGYGTSPNLHASNYDFDTTGVNSLSEKMRRRIVFGNLFTFADTIASDSVTIFDLKIEAAEMINTSEEKYGPNPWYFDKSSLKLPKVLNPGDSLEFPAYFVAQQDGPQYVKITTISSAFDEVSSYWVGAGGINTDILSHIIPNNSSLKITPNPMGADGGELRFSLDSDGFTRISLYTINGELAAVLLSQFMESGEHRLHFSAEGLSSGAYKLVLISNLVKHEKSMYLVK